MAAFFLIAVKLLFVVGFNPITASDEGQEFLKLDDPKDVFKYLIDAVESTQFLSIKEARNKLFHSLEDEHLKTKFKSLCQHGEDCFAPLENEDMKTSSHLVKNLIGLRNPAFHPSKSISSEFERNTSENVAHDIPEQRAQRSLPSISNEHNKLDINRKKGHSSTAQKDKVISTLYDIYEELESGNIALANLENSRDEDPELPFLYALERAVEDYAANHFEYNTLLKIREAFSLLKHEQGIVEEKVMLAKADESSDSDEFEEECGLIPLINGSTPADHSQARKKRIVGGEEVFGNRWPWMAAVLSSEGKTGANNCGGVLLSNRHVITAAHCILTNATSLTVNLGGVHRCKIENVSVMVNVERIALHSNFDLIRKRYDVAILELETNITFTDYIQPICLPIPADSTNYTGWIASVAGWGYEHAGQAQSTESLAERSDVLRATDVQIVSSDTCKKWYNETPVHRIILNKEFICAGYIDGQKDACTGDSGGPLILERYTDRYMLVGVVSHGYGCAVKKQPGLYINIPQMAAWIRNTISYTFYN